ncbi:YceI family protein [Emticicia oligotrophica DSM 17448]|uniref:YceI family protein n=1 Tax=Emticicia oligotrophica (strain DSM 17448 / CIP 109782 / MTCC 6937 / GPTSA100-15) TaxID=929562 RepID=A0ABM5MXG2_EMTOG|nr:YceI family protein [Emticicia oligotrophica]AFK01833.1 YceI family protein [Emticicia oligotrophica DSM 17448]
MIKFRNVFTILFLLPLWAFSQQDVSKLLADKSISTINYAMKHPMHDWEAVCKDVNAVIVLNNATKSIEQVAVSLKPQSFDSGNANRDSHALEVIEALKYPKITFVSTKIRTVAETVAVEGSLTFHGITKPVTITATRGEAAGKLVFEGKFDISLTDFQVERPSLFGLKTEDLMKFKFKLIFK